MKTFTYIIRPELIIPSKRHTHITYKKDYRQVSFDISNNKIYIYDKDK
jgi:hypothetical protein